jgi:short-subunit dehydrogenase
MTKLAVVTGASSGIGLELAKQFAAHGFDLILTAEDAELTTAADGIRGGGVSIEAVQVDLARPGAVEELYARIKAGGRPVDALALNAAIGAGGTFVDTELDKELHLVDLNVRSTVHLAKYVIRDMVARGEGGVLFTSSIASTMPGVHQAVYNASQSFLQSFALALRRELEGTGVTVTSLVADPTDTDVARDGFEALMAGSERAVSADKQ